jgi:protein TonB
MMTMFLAGAALHAALPADGPHPRASLGAVISKDDYPAALLGTGAHGRTGVRLEVAPNGRVTRCSIVQSSGIALLDAATCRLLSSRSRFTPARDSAGMPVAGVYTGAIDWSAPVRAR